MTRIWTPESARERQGLCNICGWTGPYRDFQKHTVACARENMDAIRQAAPSQKHRGTVFEDWDPELTAHMKRVGERMRAEGRWTVKDSEKAGFS